MPYTVFAPAGPDGPQGPPGPQGPAGEAGAGVPIGTVLDFCGDSIPDGWLECDGQIIDEELYPALAALVGLRFDYGDSCLPRVPDLRGNVTVGYAGPGGIEGHGEYEQWATAVGERGGTCRGDVDVPEHNHPVDVASLSVEVNTSSDTSTEGGGDRVTSASISGNSGNTGSNSSGGLGADTRQPYTVLRKIIKAAA